MSRWSWSMGCKGDGSDQPRRAEKPARCERPLSFALSTACSIGHLPVRHRLNTALHTRGILTSAGSHSPILSLIALVPPVAPSSVAILVFPPVAPVVLSSLAAAFLWLAGALMRVPFKP